MQAPTHPAPKYTQPAAIAMAARNWPSKVVDTSPIWCSVDLRDGNQALPNPLLPDQKLTYFRMLCDMGFKHIEVSFPSASADEFDFTRRLVLEGHIPQDVFIMGLTQCRPHLIERTVEALDGVPRAIVHLYIATSDLHINKVFNSSRDRTLQVAVESVRQTRQLADAMPESDIRLEFSPEEFTDTDPQFALEICEAVVEAWGKASPEKPAILNLPATVERRPPSQLADLFEWFGGAFSQRHKVLLSAHCHNDQGMAVAATEMALMGGADRVEGTLFGHGERTGNVDLVTAACNLMSRGVDTGLDLSNLSQGAETVETLTGMPIYYRQPYVGEYVFTAFSGSHQDAIRKGMSGQGEAPHRLGMDWNVPYLHIDPNDVGREFTNLIRINSQSGKGGVAWVLESDHGLQIPKAMQPELGAAVQRYTDGARREITSDEVHRIFQSEFVNPDGPYDLVGYWPRPDDQDPTLIHGQVRMKVDGVEKSASADGNGPVSAFVAALCGIGVPPFSVDDYNEQALGKGSDARAVAYVPLRRETGEILYGVGIDTNIGQAAVKAIVAGINRMAGKQE
jgi:2-isopropylmalate synthase